MRIKLKLCFALFALFFLASCASGVVVTPQRTYYEAQVAYTNAWDSYHSVWLALPDTDPRKTQWVKDYHPKFLTAANLLVAWSQNVNDASQGIAVNAVINSLQDILIQLAIKKGGT